LENREAREREREESGKEDREERGKRESERDRDNGATDKRNIEKGRKGYIEKSSNLGRKWRNGKREKEIYWIKVGQ
jgi:hypothetical protein